MTDSFIPVQGTGKNLNTNLITTSAGEVHNEIVELYPDTMAFDAFGRFRTSGTGQRFDVEFLYDKQPDFFDEVTNNGAVTHNADTRDITLSLSDANNGSYAWMSSHPIPYTPGNSQLIEMTGVLNLADLTGGSVEVFLRSKISGTVADLNTITQTSWMALTGSVDWSLAHIFVMDFQSLKVGRVRFGMNCGGTTIQVAEITNDNLRNSGYWQNPNLPVMYRIYNDATYTYAEIGYGNEENAIGFRFKVAANATATMKAICCTVKSEGGIDLAEMQGIPRSVSTGANAKTVSTTLIPLLSIRCRSTFNSLDNLVLTLPKLIRLHTTESIRFQAIMGATLTGAVWANVDATNSTVEYDITASALTGGKIIDDDFVLASSTGGPGSGQFNPGDLAGLLGKTVLWARQSATGTGILTIAAIRTGSSDASVRAKMSWEELR